MTLNIYLQYQLIISSNCPGFSSNITLAVDWVSFSLGFSINNTLMIGNGDQVEISIIEPIVNGEDESNYLSAPYQSSVNAIWMEVNAPDGGFYFNITYYANFTQIGNFLF